MPRYPLLARIAPGIDLDTITIRLDPAVALPVVELAGKIATGRPRVDGVSRAVITTVHMTPAGVAFIEEMKAAFRGVVDEPMAAPKIPARPPKKAKGARE